MQAIAISDNRDGRTIVRHTRQSIMRGFCRSYGWILIMTVMVTVFLTVYLVAGITPSPLAQYIAAFTLPISFLTWIEADARSRRCTPCFDFGLFLCAGGCLSIPCYLIWTRGPLGIVVTCMFFILWILPSVLALFLWQFWTIVVG